MWRGFLENLAAPALAWGGSAQSLQPVARRSCWRVCHDAPPTNSARLAALALVAAGPPSPHPSIPHRPEDVASIDGMMLAFYEVISGPAGTPRQWARDLRLNMAEIRFVETIRLPDGGTSQSFGTNPARTPTDTALLAHGRRRCSSMRAGTCRSRWFAQSSRPLHAHSAKVQWARLTSMTPSASEPSLSRELRSSARIPVFSAMT